jgi:hypothetical protein
VVPVGARTPRAWVEIPKPPAETLLATTGRHSSTWLRLTPACWLARTTDLVLGSECHSDQAVRASDGSARADHPAKPRQNVQLAYAVA